MIFQQFQTIEWMIVQEIIRLLAYEEGEAIRSWANQRISQTDELVEFVISVLSSSRSQIMEAVETDVQAAFELIQEHMRQEFDVEIEMDDEHVGRVVEYLNRDVMRALPETAEKSYLSIIEHVRESEITDDSDLSTVISTILLEDLENGLKSGFIQSDGVRWSLDRTVSHIEKRIYHDTFNRAFERLRFAGVELVRVFKFANCRDACLTLQDSGIICIVPENEASEEARQYPNIWDPSHKYREADGHRGKPINAS
jgi:hypothetical protein